MDAVRRILRGDAYWSLYALGDLDASRRDHCQWLVNGAENALVLLYGEFGTPILFAIGEAADLREILLEERLPDKVYLQVRPAVVEVLRGRYPHVKTKPMLRMAYHGGVELDSAGVVLLGEGDLPQLRQLYDDGLAAGEAPDFFFPQMVREGTFHGVYRDGVLVAAAGTHMVCAEESIAAVGNVYTHREWRQRGLGRLVTGAVVAALRERGIETIGLNVSVHNPAVRVYESLGFVGHCEFVEGEAAMA